MTNSRSRHLSVAAIALAAMLATLILSVPSSSRAEDSASGYPARAIRIIPFPAGGTADILPRIVAEKLRERWKQPVVVENRSGAGGNIGAEFVARPMATRYLRARRVRLLSTKHSTRLFRSVRQTSSQSPYWARFRMYLPYDRDFRPRLHTALSNIPRPIRERCHLPRKATGRPLI